MDKNNIVELGRHDPTVKSVISRLNRYEDKIKHITVFIAWDDNTHGVYGDSKSLALWNFDATLHRMHVDELINDSMSNED